MKEIRAREGNGHFHWNAGGWFGGLIGGTAFMLVGSIVFISSAPLISAVWLACFVLGVTIGIVLWTKRESVTPYVALQSLLCSLGILSAIALVTMVFFHPEELAPSGMSLWWILIYPVLLAVFHLLERSGRRSQSRE